MCGHQEIRYYILRIKNMFIDFLNFKKLNFINDSLPIATEKFVAIIELFCSKNVMGNIFIKLKNK